MSHSPEAWKRLGLLFRDARNRRGLTGAELADLAGISEKAVFNSESGAWHKTVPPTFAKIAAAHGWTPESVRIMLDGGDPVLTSRAAATQGASSTSDGIQAPSVSTDEHNLIELLTQVTEFGRLCVAMGADGALRDELDTAAQRLVKSIPRDITSREHFGLAAYRPHAPGEGPAKDDAERALRAMEEHR